MRALDGVRVLDFGQGVAGPYCGMLLGDFGAEVIKVEPFRGDWSRSMGSRLSPTDSTTYLAVNRNKSSICLDLGGEEGRALARRLAEGVDVVVESFRPGVMERMGLGYEGLAAERPELIWCSITGFGEDGPYAQLPAGDSTIQAMAGLMSIIGEPGGAPLRVGNVVSDMLAGMHGFEAVLLALLERKDTGRGRRASISLFDTMLAFQAPPLTEYLGTGRLPEPTGNRHPLIAPSGVIRTADQPVTFTVLQHQWARFCAFLEAPELVSDPRFAENEDRCRNRAELMDLIEGRFAARKAAEVIESMRAADILCAPVNSYADLAADPHVAHRGSLRRIPHPVLGTTPVIASPIRFDEPIPEPSPPPVLGAQTRAVLAGRLGLGEAELDGLAERGVIPPSPR